MSTIVDDPSAAIARTLRAEREGRGWSIADLAALSGVSKAMISKIERAEASPTAMLLGRLSGAFGLTLSRLLAGAEEAGRRLVRFAEQPVWRDPETGYVRRAVSPPTGGPLELVSVEIPPGARIAYPASAFTFIHQQIWVLGGMLIFREGDVEHRLSAGDCLQLGQPVECAFANPGPESCTYLIAIVRR
jgi:transcriptional regulator with XRE-family HTH domain